MAQVEVVLASGAAPILVGGFGVLLLLVAWSTAADRRATLRRIRAVRSAPQPGCGQLGAVGPGTEVILQGTAAQGPDGVVEAPGTGQAVVAWHLTLDDVPDRAPPERIATVVHPERITVVDATGTALLDLADATLLSTSLTRRRVRPTDLPPQVAHQALQAGGLGPPWDGTVAVLAPGTPLAVLGRVTGDGGVSVERLCDGDPSRLTAHLRPEPVGTAVLMAAAGALALLVAMGLAALR